MNGIDKCINMIKDLNLDERFVGVWKGTDHGKFFKDETNSWVVNRRSDGTLNISFMTIKTDEETSYSEEVGYWYVKDGEYFEYKESDDKIDCYTFLFHSKDSIHFIIKEAETKEEPYNFIDYKVILD